MQEIKNVCVVNDGEFDYRAEGYTVEIIEVFEDAVTYVCPVTGTTYTEDCLFNGDTAVITK